MSVAAIPNQPVLPPSVDPAEKRFRPDWWLFFVTILLTAFGIVMIYDASYALAAEVSTFGHDPTYFLKRQTMWALVGVGALALGMRVRYWKWAAGAVPLLLVTCLMLAAVHFVGHGAQGGQRWIGYGPIRIQPSEFAKLALVLYLAKVIAARPRLLNNVWGGLVPLLVVSLFVIGLVEREPDLGTAMTMFLTLLIVLASAGLKKRWIAGLLAFALMAGLGLALHKGTDGYRWKRVIVFLNPESDPRGDGFQVIHSRVALGTGGLLGVGFGESREKRKGGLPAQRTDFIFAIVGEEFGLAGTSAVVLCFVFLGARGFTIAARSRDPFGALLAAGITGMITVQSLVNMGVVTASIPNTGIPLPFLSYGGSSLVATLFGVGVLLNISQYPFRRDPRQVARELRRARQLEGAE
jgi:cell division protein FtsW